MYTVYYILYTIYCILYTVYCILYTVYCILYTEYSIQHTKYSIVEGDAHTASGPSGADVLELALLQAKPSTGLDGVSNVLLRPFPPLEAAQAGWTRAAAALEIRVDNILKGSRGSHRNPHPTAIIRLG
jgi:hypothetical protein